MTTKPTQDVQAILEKLLGQNYVETDKGVLFTDEIAQALDKHYQDYYLGLLPEKREKVDPINARTLDGISSNAFNQAIDLMEARIRGEKK